jgi:hypothetical protein
LHADIQMVTGNSAILEPGWVWKLAIITVSVLRKCSKLGLVQVVVRFISAGSKCQSFELTMQLSLVKKQK